MRVRMLPLLAPPRPEDTVLSSPEPSAPVLRGSGGIDFECWRCGFPVCRGMSSVVEATNRIYRCPSCTALNRSRL